MIRPGAASFAGLTAFEKAEWYITAVLEAHERHASDDELEPLVEGEGYWRRIATLMDPLWDITHNLVVAHERGGADALRLFSPRPAQEMVLLEWKKARAEQRPCWLVIPKARRLGVSEVVSKIMYSNARQEYRHGLCIAHRDKETKGIFEKFKLAYDHDPLALRPPVSYSEDKLAFANGSSIEIRAASASLQKLHEGQGRSLSFNDLWVSEAAFVPPQFRQTMVGLINTVPRLPLVWDTFVVLETTGNGRSGYFYEKWFELTYPEKGAEPTQWKKLFMPWTKLPDCFMPFASEKERNRLLEEIRAPRGEDEEKMLLAAGCTLEMINWRRFMIANHCEGFTRKEKIANFRVEFPFCVTGDTRISTERGIIRIADADGVAETESGAIVGWGAQPEDDVWTLTTAHGRKLTGTANHPIHTPDGWVPLAELVPGRSITLRQPRFAAVEHVESFDRDRWTRTALRVTPSFARLLGFFMGDGSWYKDSVSVVCDAKDADVIEDVRGLLAEHLSEPYGRAVGKSQGVKGAYEWRLGCRWAREPFRHLGLIAPPGETVNAALIRKVCVPECIWRSPKHVVREFLRGLFEADGTSAGRLVAFSSCKEGFTRDVQLLLLGFGVTSKISYARKKRYPEGHYSQWALRLGRESSEVFLRDVGFVGQRKQTCRYGQVLKVRDPRRAGRPPIPLDMVDVVESVEPDGRAITYNVTTTPDHVFSANGILTHNTEADVFAQVGKQVFDAERVGRQQGKLEMPLQRPTLERRRVGDPAWVGSLTSPTNLQTRAVGIVRVTPQPLLKLDDLGAFSMWETPHEFKNTHSECEFIVGADCSEGVGLMGDFSVIEAFCRNHHRFVAEWRAQVDQEEVFVPLRLMHAYFNRAWIIPEIEKARTLIKWLKETDCRGRMFRDPDEQLTEVKLDREEEFGWRHGMPGNKTYLVSCLRQALAFRPDTFTNPAMLAEMLDFEAEKRRDEQGIKYTGARGKKKDDRVIAGGVCLVAHSKLPPPKKAVVDEETWKPGLRDRYRVGPRRARPERAVHPELGGVF